jgi:hypothetical protein
METALLSNLTSLERILILSALILATLVVTVLLASNVIQYIHMIQPTATLRSLPAVWTDTPPGPIATLRPSSTPLPTWTPAELPTATP